jgi:4-hydroxybenzoate polyprenyltransferase
MATVAQIKHSSALTAFLRFEYLAVALIFPLLGAATARDGLTVFRLLGIFGGAFAFHIYVSLLNDIVDLPLDRTNPARAEYPLVSGRISPGTALFITLLQIPVAAGIIYWQGGSPTSYLAMAVALGMMTIYDVWGKRFPVPPVVDVIQGIGFSSLAFYGAALTGGVTPLTWLAFLLGVLWMVIVNLMGGLRDLHSDLAFAVNTTPIYFGVRHSGTAMSIPPLVRYYGYSVQVLMMVGGVLLLLWNAGRYPLWLMIVLGILSSLGGVFALLLLKMTFDAATKDYERMLLSGLRYLGLSSAALFLILLPALPWWAALSVIALFLWRYSEYSLGPILAYWRAR